MSYKGKVFFSVSYGLAERGHGLRPNNVILALVASIKLIVTLKLICG